MQTLMPRPDRHVVELLAPHGYLRAGVNLSNFLLVTGRTPEGEPVGVSPDMARALADALGVPVRFVCYPSPGLIADAAGQDEWDVALIGAEPQRAAVIAFTPAYTEIEATYLVRDAGPIAGIADVDRPGIRIAVTDRTAYGLWLDRNITHAELVRTTSIDDAATVFAEQGLDALAGLVPRLTKDVRTLAGTRILQGRFMAVQQAMGTPVRNAAALAYLGGFVRQAVETGFVGDLIARHAVEGLAVARVS
jgi:polar amino acid transport system substrate-binding protein